MKTIALTTALLLGLAAPALASDQLARNIGVEPGVYSLSELARLKGAKDSKEAGESDRFAALKKMFDSEVVSTQSAGVTAGHAQLAGHAGVDPADYSVAEIVMLRSAVRDGDEARTRFVTGGADSVSTQSGGINGGQRQLAANAGIDAEAYSLQETAAAWFDAHTDDNE